MLRISRSLMSFPKELRDEVRSCLFSSYYELNRDRVFSSLVNKQMYNEMQENLRKELLLQKTLDKTAFFFLQISSGFFPTNFSQTIAKYPNLEVLDLAFYQKTCDEDLFFVAKSCPQVKELHLCWNSKITMIGLNEIALNCLNLKNLSFSRTQEQSIPHESDIFSLKLPFKNIEKISFRNCFLASEVISFIADNCLRLTSFSLIHSHFFDEAGDLVWKDFFQKCVVLTHLTVKASRSFSFTYLQLISSKMKSIHLEGIRENVLQEQEILQFIKRCSCLFSLKLALQRKINT